MTTLSETLRIKTERPHRRLEGLGFSKKLFSGNFEPGLYARYLDGLAGIYEVLEDGIRAHASNPIIRILNHPPLFRLEAIERDLRELPPPHPFSDRVGLREEMARRIEGGPARLIALAYIRYLGDLGGGQILSKRLRRSWNGFSNGNPPLSFFAFDEPADDLRQRIRSAIDHSDWSNSDQEQILETTAELFEDHILWFESLDSGTPYPPAWE